MIVEGNRNANLNCKINIEKYKNKRTFSFKTSELITEDNKNIFFNRLNEIVLFNEAKEEIEKDEKEPIENKSIKKRNTIIIIACTIGGVIMIVGIIALIIIIKIKRNKIVDKREKKENNFNDNINIDDGAHSKDVFKYSGKPK